MSINKCLAILRRGLLCVAATGLVSLSHPLSVRAARPGDLATKWAVNDEDPASSMPSPEERNRDPMEFAYFLQDLLARAQMARDTDNWKDTVKYYEALAAAVPDIARPFSTLCVGYAKLGELAIAQAYCAKATTLRGARVFDHLRLIDLTLRKPQLTSEDVDTIGASLGHLRAHAQEHPQPTPGQAVPQADPWTPGKRPETGEEIKMALREEMRKAGELKETELPADEPAPRDAEEGAGNATGGIFLPLEIELRACKLAALTGDDAGLTSCMQALQGYKVDQRLVLPFAWTHALQTKDHDKADELLEQAAGFGLSSDVLARMKADQRKVFTPWLGLWKIAAGVGLAALAIWGLNKLWRRRARNAATRRLATELEAETGG